MLTPKVSIDYQILKDTPTQTLQAHNLQLDTDLMKIRGDLDSDSGSHTKPSPWRIKALRALRAKTLAKTYIKSILEARDQPQYQ